MAPELSELTPVLWHEAATRISLPSNLLRIPNNSPVPIYTPGWGEAQWELSVQSQEHNTVSPARARAQTAHAGDERTNHETTAPQLMVPRIRTTPETKKKSLLKPTLHKWPTNMQRRISHLMQQHVQRAEERVFYNYYTS